MVTSRDTNVMMTAARCLNVLKENQNMITAVSTATIGSFEFVPKDVFPKCA